MRSLFFNNIKTFHEQRIQSNLRLFEGPTDYYQWIIIVNFFYYFRKKKYQLVKSVHTKLVTHKVPYCIVVADPGFGQGGGQEFFSEILLT